MSARLANSVFKWRRHRSRRRVATAGWGEDFVSAGQLQGRTILVLEDEPIVRLDVSSILRAEGARVHSAPGVTDALTIIQDQALSLALLDVNLGETDCSEICQLCAARGIPV